MRPATASLTAASALNLLLCLSAHALTCPVRTAPLSPGDLAFAHGDFDKAESLYTAESRHASGPGVGRLHAALLRAQLRQSKLTEAEDDALAWSSANPKDSWALTALTEVQWREGNVNDALHTLQAALAADPCNPQARALSATIFRMSARYASANRELTLARKLDPIDPAIELSWLRLQPRAAQLAELTRLLGQSFLSDDDRKSLEHRRQRLADPPASGCRLVTPVASTAIPFRAIQDFSTGPTYWGLDVAFNGKHRSLQIDTGASGLILTRSAANALHLTPDFHFKAAGVGDDGDVDSFVAKVSSIKIGSLEFQDCDVQVLGKTSIGTSGQDGLIGGDVFSRFLFTLDFPGRTVKLDPLPPRPGDTSAAGTPSLATGVSTASDQPQDAFQDPSMKDWDRVFRSGHDLILPVELKPKGPWKLFLIDSGAFTDLISPDAAREVGKISKGSWVSIAGISGEVKKTWTTGPMTLYFSHLAAPNNGMLSVDTGRISKGVGVEISGLIGAPTLHQLTVSIDYRDNLVHFTFDPKRLRRCIEGMPLVDCY
jgi:predicted aspartyl protease